MSYLKKISFFGFIYGIVSGLFYYSCTLAAGATPLSLVCMLGVAPSLPIFFLIDKILDNSIVIYNPIITTAVLHSINMLFCGFIVGLLCDLSEGLFSAQGTKERANLKSRIIISIVTGIILAVFVFFIYMYSSDPQRRIKPDGTWKIFTNYEAKYGFNYPKTWTFIEPEESTYFGYTTFYNSTKTPTSTFKNPSNAVFGEIRVMTSAQIRGEKWKNLSRDDFYNSQSDFWIIGKSIGGGPGTTQEIPVKKTGLHGDYMVQKTYPTQAYEGTYPELITVYFYFYYQDSPTTLIVVSLTYDERSDVSQSIKEFDTIMNMMRFESSN